MCNVAEIILEVSKESLDENKLKALLNRLPNKEIQFTFDKTELAYFNKFIQENRRCQT